MPLVPRTLHQGLGSCSVPLDLVRRYDLPSGLRLADLDEHVWTDLPLDTVRALADAVVAVLRRSSASGVGGAQLVPAQAVRVVDLAISSRSRTALVCAGLVSDGELLPTPLGRIAGAPNLGAIALLDILTGIERVEGAERGTLSDAPMSLFAAGPAVVTPAGARRSLSPAVARAARLLVSRRWAPKVLVDDPRLGSHVSALHPLAETARHAGELLLESSFDAPAARKKGREIREFVVRADALRHIVLTEELDQIIAATVDASAAREMVRSRLGFSGEEPATLETAGRAANVTRERARQVTKRFRDDVSRCGRVWTPALDRALAVTAASSPTSCFGVQHKLKEAGITEREFSLNSLTQAAELFGAKRQFEYDSAAGIVHRDGHASVGRIVVVARKLVSHWGATTVDDVEALLEEQAVKAGPALICLAIEAVPGFAWLDSERGWFWLKGVARNRLLNQVEKIMAVAGSIAVNDLRNGVGRHHRMQGFRPPRDVLARLCEDSALYQREGDRIVGGRDLPDWNDVLGENERGLVEILFEHGPVMRKDELVELAVDEKGLNRNSIAVYLTYSPVLERYAPGVWGLRGAPVTAAEIHNLIPPRVRFQVLQDHGWTQDSRIWVAYKISRAAVESGVLGAPAALRGVAQGPFALFAESGPPTGTLVIEDNMWGLSPFLRRWGVEAGDYLVITLDLSERKATIAVGTEELLLRYQSGE